MAVTDRRCPDARSYRAVQTSVQTSPLKRGGLQVSLNPDAQHDPLSQG
jgi:hypothetical protein